jgi:tetratricopeptide (TPR) repeat protein
MANRKWWRIVQGVKYEGPGFGIKEHRPSTNDREPRTSNQAPKNQLLRTKDQLVRTKAQSPEFTIHHSLFTILLLAASLAIFTGKSAFAQQPGNVILNSNEQVFSVLAALNAAGYDTGLGAPTGDNTRDEVRAYLDRQNLPVRAALRKFYAEHRVEDDPGADLGQYVSLALLLGPPPEFKFTVNAEDLPPDAKAIQTLVPLLKTFDREANLDELWARVQPRYQAAIERYSAVVRRQIELTDAYLGFPSGAYLGRTYNIDVSLLGAPEQVQARIYGENYYLVVTPSKQPKLTEIRHQYLHFLLDPLAAKYALEIKQKQALESIAREAPALEPDFREDFPLFVTECLIRAVELRMDKPAQAEKRLNDLTLSGLILAPYFYDALGDYAQQKASMSVFYKPMILGINVREEQQKLAKVKFSAAPTPEPAKPAPALSEKDRLLNQGDNLIYEGKYAEARAAFQSVLEKNDPKDERALFGVALASANLRKPDTAERYFRQTLEVARNLRLVTWSHIYLGRIFDLEDKRETALAQYRAASLTAAAYPDAVRAVREGLARPFGSKPGP